MADDLSDRSGAYVAAGVLFFDEIGRVLLVQPTYRDYWNIPVATSKLEKHPRKPQLARSAKS